MMRAKLLVFAGLFCAYGLCYSASSPYHSIKLAIFDNPQIAPADPLLSEKLQNAYMQGIDTAVYTAKQQGYAIDYQTFFYGDNLLNIIQQVPNVKAWKPDVIAGLHSSNESLMSRTFFSNELVLSITATDVELSQLGANFYSLGTPDPYIAKALVKFINQQFPKRNLFIMVGAESKESVDFDNLVSSLYLQSNPELSVVQSNFISDNIASMPMKTLMHGYHQGDLILLFSIAGTYDTQVNLMNRIANYLAPEKVTFITSVDNWQGRTLTANVNDTINPYSAYRLDTLYINKSTPGYRDFTQSYAHLYHAEPVDSISFITYQTIMSFVTAVEKYPAPKGLTTRQAVMWSYQKALKQNPSWFRFMQLVVYKIEPHQEVYFTTIQ